MVTPPHNAGPEGAGEPDSGQPNAGQPNPGPAKSGQRNTGAENARLEQIKRSWQQKRQITDRLADVQTKIGIYSGKGGVGKTTVSVNLAVTLAKEGNKVGLLDVDIDCPNVTKVLGIADKRDY